MATPPACCPSAASRSQSHSVDCAVEDWIVSATVFVRGGFNESHAKWRDRTLRNIIAKMRHDDCGVTGVDGATSRPVRKIVLRTE